MLKYRIQNKQKDPIWINKNQTSFLQLIEGLIDLKYIATRPNQGKEKLIKECADFFGVELSKNWKSNLSKSKHDRNNDYRPKILVDLYNHW